MKTLRTLLALAFATALAGSFAFADDQGKKPEAKPEKAPCGCVVKKDGKVCGVDSDCCCSGENAKGKDKAADKKADKKDKKEGCCAGEQCADGQSKAEKGDKKADKKSDKAKDCAPCETCK